MSYAKGSQSVLAFAEETEFGTTPTEVDYYGLPFTSETLNEQIGLIRSEDMTADRTVSGVRGGNFAHEGSITTDFALGLYGYPPSLAQNTPFSVRALTQMLQGSGNNTIEYFELDGITNAIHRGRYYYIVDELFIALANGEYNSANTTADAAAFGGIIGTALTVGGARLMLVGVLSNPMAYSDTIVGAAVASYDNWGFTFEKRILGGSTPLYTVFSGGKVSSVDISIPQNGPCKATWNLMFLSAISKTSHQGNSPTTIPYPTGIDPFTGHDCMVSLGELNPNRPVRSANITISTGLDGDTYVLNSRERSDLSYAERQVSGSLTTFFRDTKEYDLFKSGKAFSLSFSFISRTNQLIFNLRNVRFSGTATPTVSGSGSISGTLNFTASAKGNTSEIEAIFRRAGGTDNGM